MHEKCVEFVVEYCKISCPTWAHCIATSMGFDNGDKKDKKDLLFCLKCVEAEIAGIEVDEEQIELEIEKVSGML